MHCIAFTLVFLVTVCSLSAESVHGVKWHDRNGNATRDDDEPGLAGVTIYVDSNQNGKLDAKEPRTVTMRDNLDTDFDESGLYWLEDLSPGRHVIREVVPDGFVQTFPRSEFHNLTLNRAGVVEGIDFGNQSANGGSIHGVKWHDRNENARRDADEPGLAGVTIYVDINNNGQPDAEEPRTLTMNDNPDTDFDEGGQYWLVSLSSGEHIVREVVPDGFVQTFPAAPGSHVVALATGGVVEGVDFGNQSASGGSIHGVKWHDRNGNATRDDDEPGLAGVTIYVDVNNNSQPDAGEPRTVTMEDNPDTDFDESGLYWLEGLSPGRHVVREVVPDGFAQTFPAAPGSHIVALEIAGVIEGIDFGNKRKGGRPTILEVEKVRGTLLVDIFAPSGNRYFEQISSDLKTWTPTGVAFDGNDAVRTIKISTDREPLFLRYDWNPFK